MLNKRIDGKLSIHGLSFTEFTIMYQLAHNEAKALSRIRLADSIGLTASGVTRLLAPMEKNNIVLKQSNPRDARQSLVTLTPVGEQLLADALISFEEVASSIYSLVSADEIAQLTLLLHKIR